MRASECPGEASPDFRKLPGGARNALLFFVKTIRSALLTLLGDVLRPPQVSRSQKDATGRHFQWCLGNQVRLSSVDLPPTWGVQS